MRFNSEAEFLEFQLKRAKNSLKPADGQGKADKRNLGGPGKPQPSLQAIARKHCKGRGMNKLETRFSQHLDGLKALKEISDWKYEAVTLKLAHDTRYTPDFMVIGGGDGMTGNADISFYEVKGFFRDDAKVKLKVAAEMFPYFTFYLVQWINKEWQIKEL